MKYIPADKLLAEIERLKDKYPSWQLKLAMEDLCNFITSLQQEQPPLPSNLDEAAEENFETMEVLEHENIFEETHRKIFKAGAEWQIEQFEKNRLAACDAQTKEEYDMETAFVDKIIKEQHRTPTFSDAIKHGMEWMAGQGITKEAVIGMATEEISINVSEQALDELDLRPGDKVVVQIRKK